MKTFYAFMYLLLICNDNLLFEMKYKYRTKETNSISYPVDKTMTNLPINIRLLGIKMNTTLYVQSARRVSYHEHTSMRTYEAIHNNPRKSLTVEGEGTSPYSKTNTSQCPDIPCLEANYF